MTEAQLLSACLRAEPRAQTAFYEYFKKRVWAVCRRYTRTTAEAEDVLQEVFIKLFGQLHKVQKPESLGGWVRQVTVTVAVDYYRSHARENGLLNLEESLDDVELHHYETPLAIERLSYQEMLDIIHSLPEGYRMVLNLYVIDGYTHPEIAQMLGISEGTSRSQLSRAKEAFRRRLESEEKKTIVEPLFSLN
jgi:RNA polymerase sigma-70 factor (ECF subfamily)